MADRTKSRKQLCVRCKRAPGKNGFLCVNCTYQWHSDRISQINFVQKEKIVNSRRSLASSQPAVLANNNAISSAEHNQAVGDKTRQLKQIFENLTPTHVKENIWDRWYTSFIRTIAADDTLVVSIVDLIFNTTAEKPYLYDKLARICKNQVDRNIANCSFTEILLSRVKMEFDGVLMLISSDTVTTEISPDDRLTDENKKKLIGIMRLIGELFGKRVLSNEYFSTWFSDFEKIIASPPISLSDGQQFALLCAMECSMCYVSRNSGQLFATCAVFACRIISLRKITSDPIKAEIEALAKKFIERPLPEQDS